MFLLNSTQHGFIHSDCSFMYVAFTAVWMFIWQGLKGRSIPPPVEEGNSLPMQYSLESYVHQQPVSPPGSYPIPDTGMHNIGGGSAFAFNHPGLSVEEKKEYLVVTRNSLELLSSILDAEAEPKPLKVSSWLLITKQKYLLMNGCNSIQNFSSLFMFTASSCVA